MLLSQVSPSDAISRRGLDGILSSCPILQDAQFFTSEGPATRVKQAGVGTAQADYYRAIGSNTPANTAGVRSYLTPAKYIFSWKASVDTQLEDRNQDPESEMFQQCFIDGQIAGYKLQGDFFNGDNGADAETFDGFVNTVDASWVTEINSGNGIILLLGNDSAEVAAQQAAVEQIRKDIRRVRGGATHMYMDGDLLARWLTIAKNLGYYRQTKDELGNDIEQILGVTVRDAGMTEAGVSNLPFTESVSAGAANCSSIYFARWGEGIDLSVLTSVGMRGRDPVQAENLLQVNYNMDINLVLQNKTALVRSKGWRLTE